MTLREEALIRGDILCRRAACFAVALALRQVRLWGAQRWSDWAELYFGSFIYCIFTLLTPLQRNSLQEMNGFVAMAT